MEVLTTPIQVSTNLLDRRCKGRQHNRPKPSRSDRNSLQQSDNEPDVERDGVNSRIPDVQNHEEKPIRQAEKWIEEY